MSLVPGSASSNLNNRFLNRNKLFTRIKDTLSGNFAALGLINIYQKAGDPDLERKILENGASYGYQLGVLIDVVDHLISRLDPNDIQNESLDKFFSLKMDIDSLKYSHRGLPDAAGLIHQIDQLAEKDSGLLVKLQAHINKRLSGSQVEENVS